MRKLTQENNDLRQNHDRWLISYADFITLMFAFFVVLYAMNEINSPKHARSISPNEAPTNPLNCDSVNEWSSVPPSPSIDNFLLSLMIPSTSPIMSQNTSNKDIAVYETPHTRGITLDQQNAQINYIAQQLYSRFQQLIDQGKLEILESTWGISIDINASILFSPANASLSPESRQTLDAIADLLLNSSFPIRVEGYTDNKPISSRLFASNWELSSARASGVVRYFISQGIAGSRLAATGYADNQPVADNSTEAGRARNRRVVLKVLAENLDTTLTVPTHPDHANSKP